MTLDELEAEIAKIKQNFPNAGDMEIGPVIWGVDTVIMYIDKITIEPTAGFNNTPAIGIHWSC